PTADLGRRDLDLRPRRLAGAHPRGQRLARGQHQQRHRAAPPGEPWGGAGQLTRSTPNLTVREHDDGRLAVVLSGDWLVDAELPAPHAVLERLDGTPGPVAIGFETADLGAWDSALVALLVALRRRAETAGVQFDPSNLPDAVQR